MAIDFGADYNHGGSPRWSPVAVEIFMTSRLARKIAREPVFFTRGPKCCQAGCSTPAGSAGSQQSRYRSLCGRSPSAAGRCCGVDLADIDAFRVLDQYNQGPAA
jgi:hypothetical protein